MGHPPRQSGRLGSTAALIVSLLTCAAPARALEPVVVGQTQESYVLGPHLEYLEDKTGKWTIDDIASTGFEGQWRKHDEPTPTFGLTESVYWFRVFLHNQSQFTDWVLEVAYPHLDHVFLFIPTAENDYRFTVGTAVIRLAVHSLAVRNSFSRLLSPIRLSKTS